MKEKSSRGFFKVRNNRLLVTRIGAASGQIQRHFYKPVGIDGNPLSEKEAEDWKDSIRVPPTRKGIFTFPSPMDDMYYYVHAYRRWLPKKYKNLPSWDGASSIEDLDEREKYIQDRDQFFKEYNEKFKEVVKSNKKKHIWVGKPFYSHICPKGLFDDGRAWWKYDNVSDWVASARKYIWCYYGWRNLKNENVFGGKIRYDVGHFEIFIPD